MSAVATQERMQQHRRWTTQTRGCGGSEGAFGDDSRLSTAAGAAPKFGKPPSASPDAGLWNSGHAAPGAARQQRPSLSEASHGKDEAPGADLQWSRGEVTGADICGIGGFTPADAMPMCCNENLSGEQMLKRMSNEEPLSSESRSGLRTPGPPAAPLPAVRSLKRACICMGLTPEPAEL